MPVVIFSTTFVGKISHSKNCARYDQKCTMVFMQTTCYSCQILMKLEFPWHIFKKYSNIKFHADMYFGSRTVPCGQICQSQWPLFTIL